MTAIELPRNCRIIRVESQPLTPDVEEINEHMFHGGHGLVTLVERADSFPDAEWMVLEYPKGTNPYAVVRRMQHTGKHLWDVVIWNRPKVLLIRNGPLSYRQLWVNGAKPLVHVLCSLCPRQDLYQLMLVGFWSMVGPKRVANMRLEGMEQAKMTKGVFWGSWSDFVDPEKEM